MSSERTNPVRRAFSLVELLVVIIIIAIVIAIIVPALSMARDAARVTSTAALLNDVTNAAMQFSQDNGGRMPGYFEPYELGAGSNEDRGLTTMENVMLDLNGQDAIVGTAGLSGNGNQRGPNTVEVGPQAGAKGRNVLVDLDKVGTGNTYFNPDPANYVAQNSGSQVGKSGHTAADGSPQLADVVDAFGTPLLAWVEDPTAPKDPKSIDDFASRMTQRGSRSKFYWASNAGFLQSTSLGKLGKSQQLAGGSGSLISNPDDAPETLTAVLGNPGFPAPSNWEFGNVYPAASRGAFMVHSAGADGIYLSAKDKGARVFGVNGTTTPLEYKYSFFADSSTRHQDSSGKAISLNIMDEFDDLISTGGN